MKYSIEPLNISGSNRFGRTFGAIKGVAVKDVLKEGLEEALGSIKGCDGFYLTAKLPIGFRARVLRNRKPGQELVRLTIAGKQVVLIRDTYGQKGDVSVSCDPDGNNVPAATLNIAFRNINDDFTDRGLVWVRPGPHATMGFVIKSKALRTPGLTAEIVTAAEEAVENKILKYAK